MDKIEYEKLEWMKDTTNIPNIEKKSNDETANVVKARFDFNGKLISPEDNDKIPTNLALHHHGLEPEQAGYAIDELYHLIRSKFNQQRFIAIKCLGNIIENCHLGEYRFQLKDPMLLDQLIDSGLIFLLRFSLDNQIESIITITLKAFKSLLQPVNQEEWLDRTFNSFYNSYQCPALNPFSKLEQSEIKELNDLEYIKLDTVKALFRMNLIERFIYLIDYFKLNSAKSLEYIFDILIRIARHSAESCYVLHEKYQSLVSTVVKNFIPLSWNLGQSLVSDDGLMSYSEEEKEETSINVYNRPYKGAVKFIRLLCQSSRSIAMCLYKNYDLKTIAIRYLTLNIENYLEIKVEIINLMKVLTIFEINNDFLTDAYELLLKEFMCLISNFDSNGSLVLLEAYMSLFNCIIVKLNKPSYIFNGKLCMNVFEMVLKFLKMKSLEMVGSLNVVSQCLDYLTHYLQLKNVGIDENFKKIDLCNLIFKNEYLNLRKFISSDVELSQFTKYFCEVSLLLNKDSVNLIKANNLSYLPTFLMPVSINDTYILVFNFFVSLLRLLVQTFSFKCDDLDEKLRLCKLFLSNSYVKSYLRKAFFVQQVMNTGVVDDENCYFTKYEYYFGYYCVKLALNLYNYQVKPIKKT